MERDSLKKYQFKFHIRYFTAPKFLTGGMLRATAGRLRIPKDSVPYLQVEQERANSEVLAIQHEHQQATACAEGKAEAERCLTFLAAVRATYWQEIRFVRMQIDTYQNNGQPLPSMHPACP